MVVLFGECRNGGYPCPCPCHVRVLALELVELGLLGPAAARTFTCLVHVCLLFACIEPSIENFCQLYVGREREGFAGKSNAPPVYVAVCCLG